MNSDIQLLNEIYQNSTTAINAITTMLNKAHGQKLYDCLFEQMLRYRKIAEQSEKLLLEYHYTPKTVSAIDKSGLNFALNIVGFGKISPHRMAKILIHGSTEGIYEIVTFVNTCADASKSSRHLAYDLIKIEEDNIEKLNNFLKLNK